MRSWVIAALLACASVARADELETGLEQAVGPMLSVSGGQNLLLVERTTSLRWLSLHDTHPELVEGALRAVGARHGMRGIHSDLVIREPDQAATLMKSGVDAIVVFDLDSAWGTPRLKLWVTTARGDRTEQELSPTVEGLLSLSWLRIGALAFLGLLPLAIVLWPRSIQIGRPAMRTNKQAKIVLPPPKKYEDGVPLSEGALELMKPPEEMIPRPPVVAPPKKQPTPKPETISMGSDEALFGERHDTKVDEPSPDTISILGSETTPAMVRERYRIVAELGRGAMGIVYCARDLRLDRDVALKVMSAEVRAVPEAIRLFETEARALAQLNHPNIVGIYDQADEGGELMLVMELIDGLTLDRKLIVDGPIPWRDLLGMIDQLCDALAYAHGKSVIHRDVKPANLFLTKDGRLKLADFGLARMNQAVIGRSTMHRGTPLYMSPEQITGGEVDHRTDLYAVGTTMFELLTGRPMFHEGDFLYQHVNTEPPKPSSVNPDLPPEVDALVYALTRKSVDERPRSAQAVRGMIAAILKLPGNADKPSEA